MPKKSRVRKSRRSVQRGGVGEPSSTSSNSTSNEPSWSEKFTNFFKKITSPDPKREEPPATTGTFTVGQKVDNLTSDVRNTVDEAKEKVGNITSAVSDLFNTDNTNNSGETINPMHNQGGGKSRRRRKRKTAARSTIRSNISKKITKIVNMVKNRMTCKNKHKKSKRNYRGGSSVSYYGSYPNSVGKINVPVPPK